MNPGRWTPSCGLLTPPHLPPTAGPTFRVRVRVGERGHNAGQGRGVSTSKPPASGSGHMPGAGTGKKEELLAWKEEEQVL